jgi:hypothetical protein
MTSNVSGKIGNRGMELIIEQSSSESSLLASEQAAAAMRSLAWIPKAAKLPA